VRRARPQRPTRRRGRHTPDWQARGASCGAPRSRRVDSPWRVHFAVAPDEFELPPAGVAEHDTPEFLDLGHRLGGQEIPGLLPSTAPSNDQHQGVGVDQDRDSEYTGLDGTMATSIPEQPMIPRPLSPHELPGRVGLPSDISQLIPTGPAKDEANLVVKQARKPGRPSKTLIEDMPDAVPQHWIHCCRKAASSLRLSLARSPRLVHHCRAASVGMSPNPARTRPIHWKPGTKIGRLGGW
jgi:hypothetical protein